MVEAIGKLARRIERFSNAINSKLNLWTGRCAVRWTGTQPNLAGRGALQARASRLLPFSNILTEAAQDEFLEWFPSVSRDQVHQVLVFAKSSLEQPVTVA